MDAIGDSLVTHNENRDALVTLTTAGTFHSLRLDEIPLPSESPPALAPAPFSVVPSLAERERPPGATSPGASCSGSVSPGSSDAGCGRRPPRSRSPRGRRRLPARGCRRGPQPPPRGRLSCEVLSVFLQSRTECAYAILSKPKRSAGATPQSRRPLMAEPREHHSGPAERRLSAVRTFHVQYRFDSFTGEPQCAETGVDELGRHEPARVA